MEKKTKCKAKGLVYGRYWGGGEGAYAAKPLEANTEAEILKQGVDGLDGSLDAGMGYESLIGALLEVTTITTIEFEGKEYHNKEEELHFIGNLNEEQQDFLTEHFYNL